MSHILADCTPKAQVYLKKGEGRTLNAGGAWVFDNEIDRMEGSCEPGEFVEVFAFNNYPLGTGFYNPHSKIRIRMMSRKGGQVVDAAFLHARLEDAVEYRMRTVDMSSCRLIFGDADFFPGLTVDKFEDVLVVQALSYGMDRLKIYLVEELKEILSERGFAVRGVYERSDAKERKKEGLPLVTGFIGEPFDTKVEIVENGVHYYVDVAEGQKTGFFLDQKYNRKAIWPMCKGAKVLDCFTHTGSFALNAGLAGAADVLGVDASQLAVDQATENAALNGLQDRVHFQCADVFDLLPALEQRGEQFDVVILDPPAFTKSRESVKNAVKGYREINMRGLKLVKPGGYLATCSCSHFMTRELFEKMMTEAAKSVHLRLKMVEARNQAPDHPILWGAQESYYLKFYIFQICEEK
jgi:23S rRNA (cytosine1962-C5)-methyltransferase